LQLLNLMFGGTDYQSIPSDLFIGDCLPTESSGEIDSTASHKSPIMHEDYEQSIDCQTRPVTASLAAIVGRTCGSHLRRNSRTIGFSDLDGSWCGAWRRNRFDPVYRMVLSAGVFGSGMRVRLDRRQDCRGLSSLAYFRRVDRPGGRRPIVIGRRRPLSLKQPLLQVIQQPARENLP